MCVSAVIPALTSLGASVGGALGVAGPVTAATANVLGAGAIGAGVAGVKAIGKSLIPKIPQVGTPPVPGQTTPGGVTAADVTTPSPVPVPSATAPGVTAISAQNERRRRVRALSKGGFRSTIRTSPGGVPAGQSTILVPKAGGGQSTKLGVG